MIQILLFIALFFTNHPLVTHSTPSETMEIQKVLQQKENAVNQKNKRLFVSVLDSKKTMYLQEQKHWFDDAITFIDANSFRIKRLGIKIETSKSAKVWIMQEYRHHGKLFSVKYPLRFKLTKNGWKDTDLAFQSIKNGAFTIYYTNEGIRNQAQIALKTLENATSAFQQKYHWKAKHIEVKLYDQPEVFRQSVKPSLPEWAGGWHESRQAIKFIGGVTDNTTFSHGIVHECTHQMVSEMTNDNAAYWLQEGAAMYYERHLWGEPIQTLRKESLLSLSQLEKMNLEALGDQEARRYYISCYYLFKSCVERYGEKKLERVMDLLAAHPEIDLESGQKIPLLNQRTRNAMERIK